MFPMFDPFDSDQMKWIKKLGITYNSMQAWGLNQVLFQTLDSYKHWVDSYSRL